MLNLFNNLSIRYKLISTFSLFAVLIALFVFFFFPYQQRKQILNQAIDNSLAISKMTADNLAASLEFGDRTTAQEVLALLKENEGFVFASVTNANGISFADLNQDRLLQLNLAENIESLSCLIVDDITITTVPILSQGNKVGILVLGLSIKNIKAVINRNTTIALLISILLVLSTILTSMFIGNVISKPIQKVIEVSSKIAEGDFNSELRVTSRDEVGKLAQAFNEMTRKLKMSIAERRKAEKEIKEARDFLKNVIENSKDGILIVDEKGYILSCNPAIEQMSGVSKEELRGKHASTLIVDNKERRKEILEKIAELLEKGYATYEATYQSKEGKYINVECTSSMIKNEKGDYISGVSILRDISERKEMEHKLLQSEKLKSLGELAGGVAHNFNNVLAIILGRAQLLKINIGPPPDQGERRKSIIELKKGLETIERASLDGAETVRRIQEFARRRDDDKYFTSVDTNKVIDDALEFTKLEWKNGAESKGITINIKKELSALPSVAGSAAELREVLTNLINNAVFAMPQGGTITVKTFKKGSYACIKVQDTGMGIPKAIRDRIFDPFFTTKGPQSSGLGMSVSYGIIERHRGTISVDSVEGKGTTFTIEIPFSEKTEREGKVVPITSGQKKVNILIVEDEEDVRNLLKDILTHEGHRVETAPNGKLGIEKFKKKNFDMVLTDLGMPGMSGWQVAEKIKATNGKVPVALITGWSIDLNESEMKEKGIDFIINKPCKLDQLVNVIQEGMILRDKFKAV